MRPLSQQVLWSSIPQDCIQLLDTADPIPIRFERPAGRVVADARPDELVDDDWSVVCAAEPEQLAALLTRQLVHFERVGDEFRVAGSPALVGRLTAEHRIPLLRLDTAGDSDLERTFLRLTQGEFAVGQAERG